MAINSTNIISEEKNNTVVWWLGFVRALFSVFLFTYLLLILVETLFEDSVSLYFNLNYMLLIVIILGIAAILGESLVSKGKSPERSTHGSKFLLICVGIGSAATIWFKTQDIGWISYPVSLLGGGLVVLLAALGDKGDEGKEIEEEDRQND